MQSPRRPVARTVPPQLRPERGPAGIPSPLRRHHVMIGDTQVSDDPPFQASEEKKLQRRCRDVRGRRRGSLVDSLRDGLAGKRSLEGMNLCKQALLEGTDRARAEGTHASLAPGQPCPRSAPESVPSPGSLSHFLPQAHLSVHVSVRLPTFILASTFLLTWE